MLSKLDLWMIIFLLASIQGFFLSILLIIKTKETYRLKNIFLALFIFFFSLNVFENIIYWTKSYKEFPYLMGLSRPFVFLFGPLLYFYLKKNTENSWKNIVVHGLPFLFFFLYKLPFFILDPGLKFELIKSREATSIEIYTFPVLSTISLLVYNYLIYIRNKIFREDENKLDKLLFYSFSSYTASYFLYYLLVYTIDFKVEYDYILSLIAVIMIFLFAYQSFLSPEYGSKKKYERALLKDFEINELSEKLETLMINEKPFLNSELGLSDIAGRLNISRNQLSQLINTHYKQSYSEYVNQFRVEEAKRKLHEEKNLTVLAIAYESGFNNKTSFNHYFKKVTGYSPSQYKKQN